MSRFAIIKKFLEFPLERKKWWIVPKIIFLQVLGSLRGFAMGSVMAAFIHGLI